MPKFNQFQKLVLERYDGGEFSYIQSERELEECGDSLLIFLVREMADSEGCDGPDEAFRRMNTICSQVEDVRFAVQMLPESEAA